MGMVGKLVPGQVADLHDDVRLLHADALRDDAVMHAGHAVLLIDAFVGLRGQRLAVDEDAVAIEYDQSRVGHAGNSFNSKCRYDLAMPCLSAASSARRIACRAFALSGNTQFGSPPRKRSRNATA